MTLPPEAFTPAAQGPFRRRASDGRCRSRAFRQIPTVLNRVVAAGFNQRRKMLPRRLQGRRTRYRGEAGSRRHRADRSGRGDLAGSVLRTGPDRRGGLSAEVAVNARPSTISAFEGKRPRRDSSRPMLLLDDLIPPLSRRVRPAPRRTCPSAPAARAVCAAGAGGLFSPRRLRRGSRAFGSCRASSHAIGGGALRALQASRPDPGRRLVVLANRRHGTAHWSGCSRSPRSSWRGRWCCRSPPCCRRCCRCHCRCHHDVGRRRSAGPAVLLAALLLAAAVPARAFISRCASPSIRV